MDLPSDNLENHHDLSLKKETNSIIEAVRKFKQLDSAVRQGQIHIIESLLEEGAPVNGYEPNYQSRTPLHSSVYSGDARIVEKLLQKGASVNAQYACDTPLTLAAKFEKYHIVDILLTAKNLNNCSNAEGITHFHIACMRNQVDIVKKLLKSKQDVNVAVNSKSDYWPGFSPLHFAAQFQCVETVEFLLSIGADITIENTMQRTPLHLAHMLRHERIIDMILSAHEGVLSNPRDKKGLSHFHIACTRNKLEIVEYFIKIDMDSCQASLDDSFYWEGRTPLDIAIHYGCTDVARLLLQNGSSVYLSDSQKFERIQNAYCSGSMEIVDLLTTNDIRTAASSKIDDSADLLAALYYENIELIKSFVIQSSSLLKTPMISSGWTLLHLAVQNDCKTMTKFLLSRCADVTVQNSVGKSPLHLVFELGAMDLIDLMLSNLENFDKNPIDNDGLSHLHLASARNHGNYIQHLLKHGADVNSPVNFDAPYWSGFTPLHFAAKFGSEEAARTLLEHGASYSVLDASNSSPFDIAIEEISDSLNTDSIWQVMEQILRFEVQNRDSLFNDRGFSLLHLLSVLSSTANFTLIRSPSQEMIEFLTTHPNHVNKAIYKLNCRWDGWTPLHFAAYFSRMDLAKLLIEAGADILKQATNGDTPLHLSTKFMISIDPQDSRLLRANFFGNRGLSIFHRACEEGNLELMKLFLRHGVDANHRSFDKNLGCDGDAPLNLAILNSSNSCVDAVRLLLDYGANPNGRDYRRNTPLHCMIVNPYSEIIDILVSHGADVNARNALWETPLFSLCDTCIHADLTSKHLASFLRNGTDFNLDNELGLTPLSVIRENLFVGSTESNNFFIALNTLLEHTRKLQILNLRITENNIEAYDYLNHEYSNELKLRGIHNLNFSEQCLREVELLKQTRTDRYTTLFDILFQNLNKSAVTSQNDSFRKTVSSTDFDEKYPHYGFMLKVRLREGQIRFPLLNESGKVLNFLSLTDLPRDCTEEILQYLDNQDLWSIISSKSNNQN